MQLLNLHLGRPVIRDGLTVFPVWSGAAATSRGYDLSTADLTVEERTGHTVDVELVVTNNGRRTALVLEGVLLAGGQRIRVVARSMLIQPGQTQVLEVRGVEQGRWAGIRANVRTARRAPLSVRAAQQQDRTWQRVRDLEARHRGGDTHLIGDALRSADERAVRLVGDIRPLSFQSGVLLCIAGKPVQFEVFDSPRALAAVWPALLHAAAVDALSSAPVPTPGRQTHRCLERAEQLAAKAVTACTA